MATVALGGQAAVTPIAGLVVDQQGEPSMAQCRGFGDASISPTLAIPRAEQEVECRMGAALTSDLEAGKSHRPANQARIVALAAPVSNADCTFGRALHSAEAVA